MSIIRLLVIALLNVVVLSVGGWATASGLLCPVCGEVIGEGTAVCPNDGTDLKLLGKPLDVDADTTGNGNDASGSDTDSEVPATESETDKKISSPSTASGGYKRHDEDGSRRVVEENDSGGYSDRRSRLPKDSRTAVPVRRKKPPAESPAPSVEIDDNSDFFEDYKKKRRYLWDERKSAGPAAARSKRDLEHSRQRLLNSLAAPITSMGGRVFFMGEDGHAGPVSGAEIDLQLARYRLRAGFSTFLGIRTLSARNELVFLESLSVGVQIPGRFSPFAVAKGGVGMTAADRFETDRTYLMTSFGVEAGVDAWVHLWLSITPSLGYSRCVTNNAYWNSFTFKLAVGF